MKGYVKYRLKQKATYFIFVGEVLYLKEDCGIIEFVIYKENTERMTMNAAKLHNKNSFGHNEREML